MSYDYTIFFTKDGRYFGGMAFDSFTTMDRVISPIMEKHPEVFEEELYESHDGYAVVEIKVNENQIKTLSNISYGYIEDVWFFTNLKEAVEIALEKGCRVFLG